MCFCFVLKHAASPRRRTPAASQAQVQAPHLSGQPAHCPLKRLTKLWSKAHRQRRCRARRRQLPRDRKAKSPQWFSTESTQSTTRWLTTPPLPPAMMETATSKGRRRLLYPKTPRVQQRRHLAAAWTAVRLCHRHFRKVTRSGRQFRIRFKVPLKSQVDLILPRYRGRGRGPYARKKNSILILE